MGLQHLASTVGGWSLAPSLPDTERFGRTVARLVIHRGPTDRQALIQTLRDEPADVVIARYPAELEWVASALRRTGRDVLPVGGLVYWSSPARVGAVHPTGQAGVDVVPAAVAAGPDGVPALVDELVLDIFAAYGTHYRCNPLFDPADIEAGYAQWARSCVDAPGSGVLVLRLEGAPIGLATIAPDGADHDILLAGVRASHQGRGFYSSLLEAARAWAAEAGSARVVISTQTHNIRVQRAWARSGWLPIDTFEAVHLVRAGLLDRRESLGHALS